ncbi:MAG: nuclear transport factor 2 family protein [Tannerellaceae bacterium]|nr:nuclear transport factor 2 family protein [Tannerellaceae bacterium]
MTEKEILTNEAILLTAMKGSNTHLLDQLLHDHLLFTDPTGQTITKSMEIGAYISGNLHIEHLETKDRQISIFTDTAIVTVTVEVRGSFMNRPIEGKFRYLRVWQETGVHEYKVIGGSCIPILSSF